MKISKTQLKQKILKLKNYWFRKLTTEEADFLFKFTSFLSSASTLNERRFYFINDLNEIQKCPVCGKPLPFDDKSNRIKDFCSNECRNSKSGKEIIFNKMKDTFRKNNIDRCIECHSKEELRDMILDLGKYWIYNLSENNLKLLISLTSFLPKESTNFERRYYIINDLNEIQKCPVCNKKLPYRTLNHDLAAFCSDKCRNSKIGISISLKERRQTFIEKYHCDNAMKVEVFKKRVGDKLKNKDDEEKNDIKRKRRESYRRKTFDKFIDKLNKKMIEPLFDINEYVEAKSGDILKFKCLRCGKDFYYVLKDKNVLSANLIRCNNPSHKSSMPEQEIVEWLTSLGITNICRNHRKWNTKNNFEADIFLPDYNLIIEYNGIYWHSNKNKPIDYHYNKWKFFKDMNIDCIQIFENEWRDNKEVVKNKLLKRLDRINNKISIELCDIKLINDDEFNAFINLNSIESPIKDESIKIGVYYNNELIKCVSFIKNNNDKEYDWVIDLNCDKLNYVIEKGLSGIINFFRKTEKGRIAYFLNLCYQYEEFELNQCNFSYNKHTKLNCLYFDMTNKKLIDSLDYKCEAVLNISKYDIKYDDCLKLCDCGYNVYIL